MKTKTSTVLALKEEIPEDGFKVEYEILPAYELSDFNNIRQKEIAEKISEIDAMSAELEEKIDKLNVDMNWLTNHADGIDYTIAVASGILCGAIDSFFVGEFDFEEASKKAKGNVKSFVEKKSEKIRTKETVEKAIENAKKKGKKLSKEDIEKIKESIHNTYEKKKNTDSQNGTSKALKRAIEKLEHVFKIPSDNLSSDKLRHHLEDFAHHPTLFGLFAAIIGQLFRCGVFVDDDGKWSIKIQKFEDIDKKEMLKFWIPIIISGILTWLLFLAKSKNKEKIDEKIPKPIQKIIIALVQVPAAISILEIANNWLGHLASDMAGSSTSAGKGNDGMGIPGLFVSILKEISSIPLLKLTLLPKVVDEIYTQNRFDMRDEIAVLSESERQAIPVLLNDVIVRTFYFVRHLILEIKTNNNDLKLVNWKNTIPLNNRTIVRMMTIASGTFTACDLADAAIRSAVKNAGQIENPAFWKDFILRVNFVGVGRFVIAVGTDFGMGIKKQLLIKKRMRYRNENEMLQTAKIYYLQENMWIEVEDTEKSLDELYKTAEKSFAHFISSWNDIEESLENIQKIDIEKIEEKNPNLIQDLRDILEWE